MCGSVTSNVGRNQKWWEQWSCCWYLQWRLGLSLVHVEALVGMGWPAGFPAGCSGAPLLEGSSVDNELSFGVTRRYSAAPNPVGILFVGGIVIVIIS